MSRRAIRSSAAANHKVPCRGAGARAAQLNRYASPGVAVPQVIL